MTLQSVGHLLWGRGGRVEVSTGNINGGKLH